MIDELDFNTGLRFGTCDELLCPSCNNGNLHHVKITVFDRPEDDRVTTVTEFSSGNVFRRNVPSAKTDNPSGRRHGIAIRLRCEHCRVISELTVSQHKGATLLAMRDAGRILGTDNFDDDVSASGLMHE
jgi:hypothetical protein